MTLRSKPILMVGILTAIVAIIVGCEKTDSQKTSAPSTSVAPAETTSPAPAPAKTAAPAPAPAKAVVAAEPEQKICPVMGGAIDKQCSTTYKGKTVYFCCPMCKPEFEKDPEKYVAKLPQFGGTESK